MLRSLLFPPLVSVLLLAACAHRPPAAPAVPVGSASPRPADVAALTAALRSRPIVLLGEVHDNAAQHALRAQALRALLEGPTRPALLMEQFDREHQGAIDRALAQSTATADDVIAAGAPDASSMQGWQWALYKPYIAIALEYRLPIVAVNVSRNDTRRIVRDGLAALGFAPAVAADIETAQAQAIADSHCGMIDVAQARSLVGAQVARDQFMARAIEANALSGAVLLAGDGHVRRDVGVPRWLSPATRARSLSIGLIEDDNAEQAGAYDVAFTTPAQERGDVCEGMRRAAPQ